MFVHGRVADGIAPVDEGFLLLIGWAFALARIDRETAVLFGDGAAFDAEGNLYVSDLDNHRLVKLQLPPAAA